MLSMDHYARNKEEEKRDDSLTANMSLCSIPEVNILTYLAGIVNMLRHIEDRLESIEELLS